MSCLKRAVEAAEEVMCVSAVAAILGADVEEAEPQVEDVVEAVQDYHSQSHNASTGSWLLRLMYSDRILRWLVRRTISAAREQGAFDHLDRVRQSDEPES